MTQFASSAAETMFAAKTPFTWRLGHFLLILRLGARFTPLRFVPKAQ
jgi:hypothetical protein